MKGTEKRVFIVSNEASRFSFLLSLAPGDIKGLFTTLHAKLMGALKKRAVRHPSTIELRIATLSGAAPSLTAFQNNMMYYLDALLERGEFKYFDDYEPSLNLYITSIDGSYRFPDDAFARLCEEDPPFPENEGKGRIVPFLN